MHSIFLFLIIALTSTYLTAEKLQYPLEEAEKLFEEYIVQYQKTYESKEEKQIRFDIFQSTLRKINEQNANDEDTAVYGINQFSDITDDEFKIYYSSGLKIIENLGDVCTPQNPMYNMTLGAPDSFDWREQNAVTPIKDQGNCMSCWAFSSVAHLESQYARKHQQLLDLSEQQLVDCDTGSHGCNQGLMDSALAYVKGSGIMSEQSYPYQGATGTCHGDTSQASVKVTECYSHQLSSEDQIKEYIASQGTLAIALCDDNMKNYKEGVFKDTCADVNHAVLIVGYGVDPEPHWIIKNSWSTQWGEQGYLKLQRGTNACHFMDKGGFSADVE